MKKVIVAVMLLTGVNSFAQRFKQPVVEPAIKYAETITPEALKEKLSVIASAEMEGRETASPGQVKAAQYIENYFRKIGLQPGTNSGFQMYFPIYQDSLLDASLKIDEEGYKLDESFSINLTTASNGSYDIREIIFASYGIIDSSRNDYERIDVKDKWVLVREGTPSDPNLPRDRRSPYGNAAKIEIAKKLGAKGIFLMSSSFPKAASDSKGPMYAKKPETSSTPVIMVSENVAHRLLGLNPEQFLQNIKNIPTGDYETKAVLTISKRTLMKQSSNVIGLLPGTTLKDEYIVISSHYDHIGKSGKEIFFGADDDGSGTTAVMQLANAFVQAKKDGNGPARSIVFLTVSGEEKGLLGSDFYTRFPSFPLDKTIVDLNIDMIGRIDPDFKGDSVNYVYIIGDDKLSSDLAPITDSVNSKYVKMQLDRRFNDPKDPNRFYYRSDHYNFAKNGVPVIFYFNGTHRDYHRSTDTVDKINFPLMAKRSKLVFHTAWQMANRGSRIKRDIPLVK